MENASKALIMVASVLLGVMLISVGVVLFRTFGDFSSDAVKKMNEKQIAEWNNTYLKYYGTSDYLIDEDDENSGTKTEPIRVTAHDIVSVINSARENNINHFPDETDLEKKYAGKENYYYVQVSITGITEIDGIDKAENWNDNQKIEFLEKYSLQKEDDKDKFNKIYFKCTDVKISPVTKRVYSISFKKI